MVKKILVFSPPFAGHLNVLKAMIQQNQNRHEFHLAITGWKNIEPDLSGVTIPVTRIEAADLRETDPAAWTFPRLLETLQPALELAKRFRPDLIIYDFFSLEGFLAGRELGIPYWCSIPAFIGGFSHQAYLKEKLSLPGNTTAIDQLHKQFNVEVPLSQLEMASDGLLLPGQRNLVWSFADLAPVDILEHRAPNEYIFVRNQRSTTNPKPTANGRPLVYMSLGTVVMDNLWNQQEDIREKLRAFFSALAERWDNASFDVLFVSRGKDVIKTLPKNWQLIERCDQPEVLSRAAVFVTHGGSNSFHEAAIQRVPMVVIPFFGDQPLVARRAQELGIGFDVVADDAIDTHKRKDFLNAALAERVDAAVRAIFATPQDFAARYAALSFQATNITDLLNE